MSLLNLAKKVFSILRSEGSSKYPAEATGQDIDCLKYCSPYTMTSEARLYATLQSVKYVVNNQIDGDFVECGVWRGGNSMIMAKTLANLGITNRDLYLYDTFEGMTPPSGVDMDGSGRSAQSLLKNTPKNEGSNIWCIASMDDVAANISSTGYPSERIHLVKGDVKKTLESDCNIPKNISLLRLDTDWYESTKIELETLFPRLATGGVCLIDDYGHWQGARRAVDEYLSEYKLFPLIHVTDYTGRAFIKP